MEKSMLDYLYPKVLTSEEEILSSIPNKLLEQEMEIKDCLQFDAYDKYKIFQKDLVAYILRVRDKDCENVLKLGISLGIDIEKTRVEHLADLQTSEKEIQTVEPMQDKYSHIYHLS
jgi:hypothetical protein